MNSSMLVVMCALAGVACGAESHPSRTPPAAPIATTPAGAPELVALDQGDSTFETNVTTTIRRSVITDNSLSRSARNVKIITVGSKVTLRGLVSTAAEKARIDVFARQPAGVTAVDNQIEVKKPLDARK